MRPGLPQEDQVPGRQRRTASADSSAPRRHHNDIDQVVIRIENSSQTDGQFTKPAGEPRLRADYHEGGGARRSHRENRPRDEVDEAALTADPAFDLTTALQALFAEDLVVDVVVSLTRAVGPES